MKKRNTQNYITVKVILNYNRLYFDVIKKKNKRKYIEKRINRKKKKKKTVHFIIKSILRVFIIISIGIFSYLIARVLKADTETSFNICLMVIGIFVDEIDKIKREYRKMFNSHDKLK